MSSTPARSLPRRLSRLPRSWALIVAALLALAGCSDEAPPPPEDAPPPATCADGAWASGCGCVEGFEPGPEGAGCVPVLPPAACAPGARPALGSEACAPVGWTSVCPPGMDPDPSGWGCAPVLPPEPCAGAAIEQLGETGCAPIGDCDAPFPPAAAILFVDDGYAPGELDATHFRTIGDAVAAAPSGATIAIEAGTYLEALALKRDVEIVGRCAASVVVGSASPGKPGVDVYGVRVGLRGLTLRGHLGGVLSDGELAVEDVLFDENRGAGLVLLGGSARVARTRIANTKPGAQKNAVGILVQSGAALDLADSALVRNQGSGMILIEKDSSAKVARTVVLETRPVEGDTTGGYLGFGIQVRDGAALEIEDGLLGENMAANLLVTGARAAAARTVLRNARRGTTAENGHGVVATEGAEVDLREVAVVGSDEAALGVSGAGTRVAATDAIFRGALAGGGRGVGVAVTSGGTLELVRAALVDFRSFGLLVQEPGSGASAVGTLVLSTRRDPSYGPASGAGVNVGFGATLTMTDAAVVDSGLIGIFVGGVSVGSGGSALLSRALVAGTRLDERGQFGHGIAVWNAALRLEGSAVTDHHEVGVLVGGPAATADLEHCFVARTRPGAAGDFGDGVAATEGARLRVLSSSVLANARAGLVFDTAAGFVGDVLVADNAIGLQVQRGSSLREVESAPAVSEGLDVAVQSDTHFARNQSRLGSGVVPMPGQP